LLGWDAWKVSDSEFPREGSSSDKLRYLLNYAMLAPSSHNSQPWRFKVIDDGVELYADRARALPVVDPEDRELIISCGSALFHLRMAVSHFGHSCIVSWFSPENNNDLLARVRLGEERKARSEEEMLFDAIVKRRTNRMPFEPRQIQEKLLTELEAMATEEEAWLSIIHLEDKRHKVADLIAEADRIQMADRRFRRELAAWIHSNRSSTRDGLPGYAFGYGDLASSVATLLVRTFDIGRGQAAKDRELAAGSPVLAVLGTDRDDSSAWLSVGQALSRVLLRACADGVSASFLNQPIEVPELRIKLSEIMDRRGYPQLLLRMGYGPRIRPTPRRMVAEVLVGTQ